MLRRALLLALPALALPPLVQARQRRWTGLYEISFERSAFTPRGRTETWWISAANEGAARALAAASRSKNAASPWGSSEITVEGSLSPRGAYGHLGAYPHELRITRVVRSRAASRQP